MGTFGFCISVLALSVIASSRGCSFEARSQVLMVNCSRSLRSDFAVPEASLYQHQKYERIAADYQFNRLETITKFTFAKLRTLNLANNKINMIEDGAFSKVNLYELDLSFNKITAISSKQLMGLKQLRSLSLSNNMISHLDVDLFRSMTSLEKLDLGHNYISEQLDPALFSTLSKLNSLSLMENVLSSLDPKTFQNLNVLENLSLAFNSIAELDSTTFDHLFNLKNLNLSNNKFVSLDEEFFRNLREIEYLDLSWNSLEYFGAKLGLSPSLKVIQIGHNTLKDVEISGNELRELKEIYVENNMLESLQFLTSFDTLEIVNASSNNISAVEEHTYQYLHTLDLSNNAFTSIPRLISSDKLPSLTHLHFDMNPILSLEFPPSRENFKSLQLVTFSRMPLLKEVSKDSLNALRSPGSRQRRAADSAEQFSEEEDEEDKTAVPVNNNEAAEEKEEAVTPNEEADPSKEVTDTGKETENERNYESKESTHTADGPEENESREASVLANEQVVTIDSNTDADPSKEVTDTGKETENESNHESKESTHTADGSEENETTATDEDVPKMRTAKLRVEPSQQDAAKTGADDCGGGGITLDISHNENLAKIEGESFVGIDICKLDLSYNALTSVPETMVQWNDLPSIDFQGNPWDCACSLQWLLDTIVPKLYPYEDKQHLLYELRCASPAELRDRRFVHFYNWTEPVFCTKNQNLRIAPPAGDETTGVTLRLGGSTGMFVGVGIAIGMVALLVGVAAWLHRSNTLKKRARNRRV